MDEDGIWCSVILIEVNDYLCDIFGCEVMVKDFCIWIGMVLVVMVLVVYEVFDSEVVVKCNVCEVIVMVVVILGNILVICWKCYIYLMIIDVYLVDDLKIVLCDEIE